jgi:hypothetical protein
VALRLADPVTAQAIQLIIEYQLVIEYGPDSGARHDLLRTAGAEVARFAAELGSRQGAIPGSWDFPRGYGEPNRVVTATVRSWAPPRS